MGKINWKLRLQNKATLTTMVLGIISIVYTVLGALGIVPSISQDTVVNVVTMVIALLMTLGIVIDPTTTGVSDSTQAMGYDSPSDN